MAMLVYRSVVVHKPKLRYQRKIQKNNNQRLKDRIRILQFHDTKKREHGLFTPRKILTAGAWEFSPLGRGKSSSKPSWLQVPAANLRGCNLLFFLDVFCGFLQPNIRMKRRVVAWIKFDISESETSTMPPGCWVQFEPQKKTSYISIESWLVNRDPYTGLLKFL